MERTEPAAARALLEMYRAMVLVREVEQALYDCSRRDVSQLAMYRPGHP